MLTITREGRYDRQELAGWTQDRLSDARVVVVGAGAIGNEVVKNLALVGVGTILLIDFDRVAPSNLTRCVLMRDDDVGKAKATSVARRAMALNPDVQVLSIDGDVEFDVGDAHLAEADVVVGCLDNAYARYVLNRRVRSLGRGWIDVGISQDAAQVSVFGRTGPCYACGLGDATLERLRERFSCTGLKKETESQTVPTTVVTAALSGALATQIAVDAIHGSYAPGRRWTLLVGAERWLADELSANGDCAFHASRRSARVVQTSFTPALSWDQVVRRSGLGGGARLRLPRPVLTGFYCRTCRRPTPLVGPRSRIPQELSICANCSRVMRDGYTQTVAVGDRLGGLPLSVLGYALGDRLAARAAGKAIVMQLAKRSGWDPVEA